MSKREWIDPAGGCWRLRGQPHADLGRHKIEKLMGDPAVRVILNDYDTAADVPPAARDELWALARPYYLGLIDRDATDDNRHYSFEEYINDERQHLLMVWQSC